MNAASCISLTGTMAEGAAPVPAEKPRLLLSYNRVALMSRADFIYNGSKKEKRAKHLIDHHRKGWYIIDVPISF